MFRAKILCRKEKVRALSFSLHPICSIINRDYALTTRHLLIIWHWGKGEQNIRVTREMRAEGSRKCRYARKQAYKGVKRTKKGKNHYRFPSFKNRIFVEVKDKLQKHCTKTPIIQKKFKLFYEKIQE